MIISDTPVESYMVKGRLVYVKREDLCCPDGPPFSKMRGVLVELTRMRDNGVNVVAYVETAISMAGWGIAWTCKQLGMECLLYYPELKDPPDIMLNHWEQWERYGAKLIPQPPGRIKIRWYIARKMFREYCGKEKKQGELMEVGIPLKESIEGTYREALATPEIQMAKTIVCSVGSGTILSGLVRAVYDRFGKNKPIYGVLTYKITTQDRGLANKRKAITKKAERPVGGLIGADLMLINGGWEYTEPCRIEAPFPCHAYYDAKAWAWLVDNVENLQEPILFWNIGSEPIGEKKEKKP